ncbi:GNAT family N-acetyltransferase [Rubrivivax sp. RP6-9]|uniref:GNAT family N-acetyltransferase n=1 Tax=Rubrivivax sp. RP6-9 TaxID=3415750 RepID=UPI003CC69EF3
MTEALFSTERLLCRRWQAHDIEPLYAVYSDPEAMRWVGDGRPISRENCERWLQVTEANYAARGYGMFALVENISNTVIGFCGLVHPGGQTEPEVKYAFVKSEWGRGLASEIIPALLTYGASQHGLQAIIATVAVENLASQRVLVKSGMVLREQRRNEDGSTTNVYEWRASAV